MHAESCPSATCFDHQQRKEGICAKEQAGQLGRQTRARRKNLNPVDVYSNVKALTWILLLKGTEQMMEIIFYWIKVFDGISHLSAYVPALWLLSS